MGSSSAQLQFSRINNIPENLIGYISLITMVSAGSFASILIKLAQNEGIPSAFIVMVRLGIAFLIFTPIVLPRYGKRIKDITPRNLLLIIASGLWLALHFTGFIGALGYTTVLITGVIVSTSPLWVALLELVIFRSIPPKLVWIGLLFALLGGVVIALGGDTNNVGNNLTFGVLLSIFGAIAFACYLIIGRSMQKRLPLLLYIWMIYGSAALFAGIITLMSNTSLTGYTTTGYFWTIMVGVIPQVIGHSSINLALRYFRPTYVSIILQLTVITSSIIAIFIFDEAPRAIQILGSGSIIIGVVLASIAQGQKNKQSQE